MLNIPLRGVLHIVVVKNIPHIFMSFIDYNVVFKYQPLQDVE